MALCSWGSYWHVLNAPGVGVSHAAEEPETGTISKGGHISARAQSFIRSDAFRTINRRLRPLSLENAVCLNRAEKLPVKLYFPGRIKIGTESLEHMCCKRRVGSCVRGILQVSVQAQRIADVRKEWVLYSRGCVWLLKGY